MKLLRIVWFIVIVGVLIYYIFSSGVWQDLPEQTGAKAPLQKFADTLAKGFKGFLGAIFQIPDRVVTQIQNFTNPQYQADVEQNRGSALGVTMDSLEAIPKQIYPTQQLNIKARIQGKSFVNRIDVKNNCFIALPNGDKEIGTMQNEGAGFSITQQDSRIVVCTFSDATIAALAVERVGTYQASLNSSFNFETWGYMTYSFIDSDLKNNLLESKKDMYAMYGLQRTPQPVYTAGPITLGLEDPSNPTQLPWSVDPTQKSLFLYFGITIKNRDQYGRVVNINELTFKIPKPLQLLHKECVGSNLIKFNDPKTEGSTNVYDMSGNLAFPRDITSITITCPVELENGMQTGSKNLLGDVGVAMATFAVQAKYDYELIKSTPFTIREAIG